MPWLSLGFFLTALIYASIGFGGGSTYNALLALAKTDYRILPAVALTCNIIVVSGGTLAFARAGLLPKRRALILALSSAPFAYLGGRMPIKEDVFFLLLAISLLIAGVSLLFQREHRVQIQSAKHRTRPVDVAIGAGIGFFSGLVAIGGGIFLAPWLHFSRWAEAKQIAATASLFILINSVAGLVGQLSKLSESGKIGDVVPYWPLALAVAVGGTMGSQLSVRLLPPQRVRQLTAVLIIYVALQLLWKQFSR